MPVTSRFTRLALCALLTAGLVPVIPCGIARTEAAGEDNPGAEAGKGKKASKAKAPNPKAEAKAAYKKGAKLYKQGKWQEALSEFRASFEADPSTDAGFFIGMCLEELGRWLEAKDALEGFLASAAPGMATERKSKAIKTLDEIDSHLALVRVQCDVGGASLAVDGSPTDSWQIELAEGDHEIAVSAEGYETASSKVSAAGGQTIDLAIELIPLGDDADEGATKKGKRDKKLPAYWFASTAGLTGALAVAAVITGAVALHRQDVYASMGADEDWSSYRQSTLSLGVATDVLWGIAGAAAVATVVLAFFTDFKKTGKKDAASLTLEPVLGAGWAGLQGEF